MTQATDLRNALGDLLEGQGWDVNVHRRPVGTIVPPAAIIVRGAWEPTRDTGGSVDWQFGVIVAVQLGASFDSSAENLDEIVEGIVSTLTSDQDLGGLCGGVHVPEVSGEAIRTIGGTEFWACEITVQVLG